MAGAYAIVLVHNHPSGNCQPSAADREITAQMVRAGEVLDVPLLDHVIVGTPSGRRKGYYSFWEEGTLKSGG